MPQRTSSAVVVSLYICVCISPVYIVYTREGDARVTLLLVVAHFITATLEVKVKLKHEDFFCLLTKIHQSQ